VSHIRQNTIQMDFTRSNGHRENLLFKSVTVPFTVPHHTNLSALKDKNNIILDDIRFFRFRL